MTSIQWGLGQVKAWSKSPSQKTHRNLAVIARYIRPKCAEEPDQLKVRLVAGKSN